MRRLCAASAVWRRCPLLTSSRTYASCARAMASARLGDWPAGFIAGASLSSLHGSLICWTVRASAMEELAGRRRTDPSDAASSPPLFLRAFTALLLLALVAHSVESQSMYGDNGDVTVPLLQPTFVWGTTSRRPPPLVAPAAASRAGRRRTQHASCHAPPTRTGGLAACHRQPCTVPPRLQARSAGKQLINGQVSPPTLQDSMQRHWHPLNISIQSGCSPS